MNTNNFSSSSSTLQGLSNSERFTPLFKNSTVTSNDAGGKSLKSSMGLDINIQTVSGKQVFARSIVFSLGVKVEARFDTKVPSPKEVASTVLSFVENRLNAEKAGGANSERLANLLEQAKAGVQKGYAQAEKDIKNLGLMTEELAAEIKEGFDQIGAGLAGFEKKYTGAAVEAQAAGAVVKNQPETEKVERSSDIQVAPGIFGQNLGNDSRSSVSRSSSMLVNDITASSADFVLKTREGDQVLIRFADIEQLRAQKDDQSMSLSLSQQSQFQFAIKGDLNEQEVAAINDVLEQVGNISQLFFDDQFEQAFQAAMQLGFDATQIASLSLDLAKTQVQEVRVYEDAARGALESYKRNQPLINMAQQFEKLDAMLSPFKRFEELNAMVDELVSKAIERYDLIDARSAQAESANKDRAALGAERLADYQIYAQQLLAELRGDAGLAALTES